MPLHIRRIKMEDGDGRWLLFEEGRIERPMACLRDSELQRLFVEMCDQEKEARKKKEVTP